MGYLETWKERKLRNLWKGQIIKKPVHVEKVNRKKPVKDRKMQLFEGVLKRTGDE